METHEERLAAFEAELREKYTDKDREEMAGKEAMSDGSYPIKDKEDVEKAIKAVGEGNADHDAIRKHIIDRAKEIGCSDLIPDAWQADGSIKQDDGKRSRGSTPIARRKERHRAVPLLPEVRHFAAAGLEVRSAKDADEIIVTGTPIVYDAPYLVRDLFGEFEERMRPGCVSDLLKRGVDCRLLLNHEGLAMARTTSGTLRLWDTTTELHFEAKLDARQQLANDFAIAVERGDMSQMSVGMVVGRDEWGEESGTETRDVFRLDDLLDVSGVTYPCSPTTNIQIANRMMMEVPIESRARLRRIYAEMRSGKVLSQGNQDKIVQAAKALHHVLDAAGLDPNDLIGEEDEPEGTNTSDDATIGGDSTGNSDGSPSLADGSGTRSHAAPNTADERREASLGYGDKKSDIYQELVKRFESSNPWGGPCDIWIEDFGDDWVVFESYGEPRGLWRIGYSLDGDGKVELLGDPVEVARKTDYVPIARSASTLRLRVEARKRRRGAA